ncbi:MAG: hypothetical protein Q9162_000088 [Coniocarpon cinnabarinum]
MSTTDTQQTINIPSLLAFAALTIIAVRYFFFSPSDASSSNAASSTQRGYRVPPDRIDTLTSMFPQFPRRDIEWDLRRNGANVQATTERILRDGRLPPAPQNFRAQTPPPAVGSNAQGGGAGQHGQRRDKGPQHENLIQRYQLSGKVRASGDVVEDGEDVIQTGEKQKEKGAWSSNKSERANVLKKRREDMVLAARRKMEMKERREGKAKAV